MKHAYAVKILPTPMNYTKRFRGDVTSTKIINSVHSFNGFTFSPCICIVSRKLCTAVFRAATVEQFLLLEASTGVSEYKH